MENLGNLKVIVPDELDVNTSFWNAKSARVEKYPLYKRYINCNVTDEEWSLHKKEYQKKNCYFCKSTQNGTEDGTLECTNKSTPHFEQVVTNLTICEGFDKISEILNDEHEHEQE